MNVTFGRYKLLSRLGEGSMGEVFRAKSYGVAGFAKVVAIKCLRTELVMRPEVAAAFVDEARIAMRLSHANVVQVFDLGKLPIPGSETAEETYYLAMEYVAGLDLAALLTQLRREGRTLPPSLALFIAAEIAKGLDHAHRQKGDDGALLGLVHRDVAPRNILLSWDGEVKLTDFGVARARRVALAQNAEETWDRKLGGAFARLAPEQLLGEVGDGRADLFALGTVLYECLTGLDPFSGPNPFETLRRIREGDYLRLEKVMPELSGEIAELLGKTLDREPLLRPADAARFHEACLSALYARGDFANLEDLARFLEPYRAIVKVGPGNGPALSAPAKPVVAASPAERPPMSPTGSSRPSSLPPPPVPASEFAGAASEGGPDFVGRSVELQRLAEQLAFAAQRRSRVLFLEGPTGIGKTALLEHFFATLRARESVVPIWVKPNSSPTSVDALRGAIGAAVRAILPQPSELPGLAPDDVRILAALTTPEDAEFVPDTEVIAGAFARLLARRSEDHILVLAWDESLPDDGEDAAVFAEAFAAAPRARVLHVVVRGGDYGEDARILSVGPYVSELTLGPLPDDAAAELATRSLGVRQLEPAIREQFLARTTGVPGAIVAFAEALVAARVVGVAEGAVVHADTAAIAAFQVPSVDATLRARLARLADEDFRALALLVLASEALAREVRDTLGISTESERRLTEARLLFADGEAIAPLASVLVPALAPAVAQSLHDALASAAPSPAARAAHLEAAGRASEVCAAYDAAAQEALAVGKFARAKQSFLRALERTPDDAPLETLLARLEGLATAFRAARGGTIAPGLLSRVVSRFSATPSAEPFRWRAQLAAGIVASRTPDHAFARACFEEALAQATASDERTSAIIHVAALAESRGDFRAVLRYLAELPSTASTDPAVLHDTLLTRARAHAALGDRDEALLRLVEAERLGLNAGLPVCERLKTLSVIHYFVRELDAALAAAEQGVERARSEGLLYEEAIALHNVGDLLVRKGDHARAYGALRQSLALCREAGFSRLRDHNALFLSYLDAERFVTGADLRLARTLGLAQSKGYDWDALSGLWLSGRLQESRKRPDKARVYYEALASLADRTGQQVFAEDAAAGIARTYLES